MGCPERKGPLEGPGQAIMLVAAFLRTVGPVPEAAANAESLSEVLFSLAGLTSVCPWNNLQGPSHVCLCTQPIFTAQVPGRKGHV